MKIPDIWWSCPTESENGKTVIVTGHDGLENIRESGRYKFRVEVSLDYDSLPDGMPDKESSEWIDSATEAIKVVLKKEKAVVLTGIYTGAGRRDWIFYTTSLFIFRKVFNWALEELEEKPLVIEAYEDSDWEEYEQMRADTYIPDEN